jgi:RimJ/RimL family protein N-acetyltransferase
MTAFRDAWDQPVGFPLPDWQAPPLPPRKILQGRYCRVEPLDAGRHTAEFHAANLLEPDLRGWTYLTYGPFATADDCRRWAEQSAQRTDYLFHAIIDLQSGKAAGMAAYMRIDTANGSIEIGGIKFTPLIARQPAATEAMHLLMGNAFALGYRRHEWKCDALNAPSRAAAQRLGFSYEGTFRQAVVHQDRNRDTAWYSVIDSEWPALRLAHEQWLAPENFDARGRQIVRLSDLTAPLLVARG